MFSKELVGFRPIEFDDIETLRAIRNDSSTFLQMGSVEMISRKNQEEWWRSDPSSGSSPRYTIVDDANKVIGLLRLQNLDLANGNCEVGLDIAVEKRGQGLGYAAYECVLEYLFDHKNLHMVYLKVAVFNPTAIQLYEKLGFKKYGYFPQYLFRHGNYQDYLIMAILVSEYRALRQ